MTPALARFAADLDAACETSRELAALWAQVVAAHRTARVESRRAACAPHHHRGEMTVTREEFEAQDNRLVEEIAVARTEFDRARDLWDRLCEERLTLRCDWRDQNRRAAS